MNWKEPKTNIFFVPVPYTGQVLFNLIESNFSNEAPRELFELTNPETNQPQTFEIIDYLGPFPTNKIPTWLSRLTTDNSRITGDQLARQLVLKVPEFRDAEKIVFYQLSKQTA